MTCGGKQVVTSRGNYRPERQKSGTDDRAAPPRSPCQTGQSHALARPAGARRPAIARQRASDQPRSGIRPGNPWRRAPRPRIRFRHCLRRGRAHRHPSRRHPSQHGPSGPDRQIRPAPSRRCRDGPRPARPRATRPRPDDGRPPHPRPNRNRPARVPQSQRRPTGRRPTRPSHHLCPATRPRPTRLRPDDRIPVRRPPPRCTPNSCALHRCDPVCCDPVCCGPVCCGPVCCGPNHHNANPKPPRTAPVCGTATSRCRSHRPPIRTGPNCHATARTIPGQRRSTRRNPTGRNATGRNPTGRNSIPEFAIPRPPTRAAPPVCPSGRRNRARTGCGTATCAPLGRTGCGDSPTRRTPAPGAPRSRAIRWFCPDRRTRRRTACASQDCTRQDCANQDCTRQDCAIACRCPDSLRSSAPRFARRCQPGPALCLWRPAPPRPTCRAVSRTRPAPRQCKPACPDRCSRRPAPRRIAQPQVKGCERLLRPGLPVVSSRNPVLCPTAIC